MEELYNHHYYGYVVTDVGFEQYEEISDFCTFHDLDFGFDGEEDNGYLSVGIELKKDTLGSEMKPTYLSTLSTISEKEEKRIQELQSTIESFFHTKLKPASYFLSHSIRG